jgi:C4-dicarboxylate transporter DctM subunit
MHVAVLVTIGLLTLVIGAPIFLSIMAGTIITFEAYGPPIPSMVIPQRMVDGVNKFSLLAIPLFIFAADIISRGQIGSRLVRLAESFVGHITGGLAIATVLACALFGAMSGIGPAAVVSIGPLVYPALVKQGYSRGFAVGLITTASTLAMLIPPGVAMILYALQTNSSIGAIFLAGLMAGSIFTSVLCCYAYVYARMRGIKPTAKLSWTERWSATKTAVWALGLPVFVLGGIYGGAFTPTEGGSLCVRLCDHRRVHHLPVHAVLGHLPGRQQFLGNDCGSSDPYRRRNRAHLLPDTQPGPAAGNRASVGSFDL